MYKLLIPLVAVLFGTATLLHAQVPVPISIATPVNRPSTGDAPEQVCDNFAGTFVLGQAGVNTQSNDLGLDTIFLCFGDSIFINHNGDANLSSDPDPATPPGVGWAFYDCPPFVSGDSVSLNNIVADPCILLAPTGLPVVGIGSADGDIWFFNSGALQTTYNSGKPVLLHFAPITIDDFGIPPMYESAQVGAPPGPCVDVNIGVAFEVVYLNAVNATGIVTNFANNDCLGKFRIRGGFPEWDPTARYTIDISLASDPSVKALIHTSAGQFFHSADIIFSVTQPGLYNVTVEDGKSCGHTFQMNMGSCNPVDNIVLLLPETSSPPMSQICVPITVENFSQIVSTNLSLQWDPTILQFSSVQNFPFTSVPPDVLNTQLVNQGLLGVALNESSGNPFTVANGGTLFEVCFNVIGALGECSPLSFTNTPTQVGIENQQGNQQAITADTGQVCVNFIPLTSVVEFIDSTCLATATLKVTVTGGQPPYDVIVQSLPTGPVVLGSIPNSGGMYSVSGVQNGSYRVRVIDNNGFGQEIIDTVVLNLTTLGVALDLTKLPSCNGAMDGVITANVFVGSTPAPDPTVFTYNWLPTSINENTATIDSLAAGQYFVTVTDPSGCIAVASGTLGQPAPLNEQSITVTDASCSGVEDGAITFIMEGGTPFAGSIYNFEWGYAPIDTGSTGTFRDINENPSVLDQLAAGFYYLTVTDANGCTFSPTEPLEVENLRNVEIVVTALDNTSCFGVADGSVTIEVVSTPPFTNPVFFFIWPDTVGIETNTNTTSTRTNLPAGTYGVLAAESSGCGDTTFVTITEPTRFVLDTIELVNPTCTNQNDGLIRVAGSGGTGLGNTHTYVWTPATLPGNAQQLNLAAGTYSVTASDANGCPDSLTFDLMLPPPPAITAVDSTSVKCGSDGCLTVTAPTGTSFIWQNNIGDTVATTAQACNLPGGIYSVEVRDANNCVTVDTFALDSVEALIFSDTSFTLPSCYGESNGIISVGVMGGNTPYTYLWAPTGQTTNTLIQASAGLYVFLVADANDCILADTFQLLDAPRIEYALIDTSYQAATCADSCNGRAALEVHYTFDGSVLSGDFNFLWDDGNTDSLRTNLCPGLHTVTITDGNNCFVIGEIFMQSPDSITATLTTTPTTCFSGSDGSAMAIGAGGNGAPFQYAWDSSDSTATVTNLSAGSYTVTVSDQNGCQAVFSAEVMQPNAITLTPTIGEIACFGQDDGDIRVEVAGGNPGVFTYAWSDGTNVVGTTNPLEMLPSGTYSVTATDALGCTGVLGNIVLPDALPVQGSYLPLDTLDCNGDETTLNIDTIFGGAGGPYQYSLDFGVTLNPNFPINIGGGEHYISYFDRQNCEFIDTIFVMEPAPILVSFDPSVIEIELGDSITLRPNISGVNLADLTYVWTPQESLLNLPTLYPTVYTFESQAYMLVVTDSKGCVGTGSVVVDVDPNRNVYLPNIFMPGNPRGLNDHFNPLIGRGVELIGYMRVYDRWGSLMYERTSFVPDGDNFSEGWDGKYDGQYVNPGVFVYVVEARFLDGRVLVYRGDVTVVR